MSLSQALLGPISPVLPSLEIRAAAITAAPLTPRELIFLFFKRENLTPSSPLLWHRHTTAIPHPHPPPVPSLQSSSRPCPQVDGAPPAHPLGSTVPTPATSEPSGDSQLPFWCHAFWTPMLPQARDRFRGGVWARARTSADSSASRDICPRPKGPGLRRPARGGRALGVGLGC